MAGKKVGSDGQVRKTTAEWAADTATYPEGMRLMDTTDGSVRVSKGATYALAWTQAPGGPVGFGDLTGTPQDNTSLAQQLETLANTIGTKADAANVPTILDAEFMWDVDHWVMTGVNQFPMDFTIVDLGDGEYKLQAASGTPFTEGKTGFSVALVSTQMRATPEPWQASDGWQYKTVDTSGTQLPSTDNVQVYVRVYQ